MMAKLAPRAALLAAAAALPLALVPAARAASPGQVVQGDNAFGGWKQNDPGTRRHITVDAMPAPNKTESASNSPAVVKRPSGETPEVEDGYKVTLFKDGLESPRVLRVAPNGDIFVAESQAGDIRVLRPGQDGSKPASEQVFADGLDQPYGIAFYPPGPNPSWVYVGETDKVVRFPYKAGDMKASGDAQTIVPELPTGGHWTRDVAFSPDGKRMYVAVGSGSNVAQDMDAKPDGGLEQFEAKHALGAAWGDEEGRAQVRVFDPDGKNGRAYATGIRNCAGITVRPGTDEVWCATNERDGLGDNLPPDYATRVQEHAFYGWPWYYIGDHQDPRHKGERPDLKGKITVPDVLIQPHSAPLGITFAGKNDLGGEVAGDAFVTLHGSWNRAPRTGYKVVRVLMKDGEPTGVYEDFVTNFVLSDDKVWGRPVGIAFAKDGSLLVSEDGSGTIWRVTAAD